MSSPRSFYDVVIVGASLAALATGALLARRGFRVVAIGQCQKSQTYEHDGLSLRRELGAFTLADAPAFKRVVAELALVPAVRRRLQSLEPLYQVLLPGHRIDVSQHSERLFAELRREFSEIGRPTEDFYAALGRATKALDKVLGADVIYSPDGFFERREALRATHESPFGGDGCSGDLLAEFAPEHLFRAFVNAPMCFASGLDPECLNALCRARLHGSAVRSGCSLEGGTDGLRALFAEKIVQYGGDVRLRDKVSRVLVRRGGVSGVALEGLDETLGSHFVVSSLGGAEARALTGESPSRPWGQRLAGVRPWLYRYVLNVALPSAALPVGMAPRVYSVADRSRPMVEENLLAIERGSEDPRGRVVLSLGALLPRSSVEEGAGYLRRVRERVIKALGEVIPFLEEHILVVDSPHDGRPLQDRSGTLGAGESLVEVRWSGAPEEMEPVDRHEVLGLLGACGLPCRTDVKGLMLVGRQVIPGLGAEGEMMNALTVARLITRTDRSKERLRRELWSKVEV